jgi:hypothetical protein
MASTCTFIIRKTKSKNQVCWSSYCSGTTSSTVPQFMVIEPKKGPFDHKTKIQFLRDLRSMGFDFTYRTQPDKEIHIDTSLMCKDGRQTKVLFGMYVRYLWEGTHGYSPAAYGDVTYDSFHRIVPIYNSLRAHFPRRNKFILLNMASSIFAVYKYPYNSNHFPSYTGWNIKMYTKIPIKTMVQKSSVNSVMSSDTAADNSDSKFLKNFLKKYPDHLPEKLSKEEAKEIYNTLIKFKVDGK